MNGTIGVRSALDKGSTFWFAVPLEKSLKNTTAVARLKTNLPDKPARVVKNDQARILLVVEDNGVKFWFQPGCK